MDQEETYPYETDTLEVMSNEEIAKLGSEAKKISILIQASIAATLEKHPKAQSSEVHRKTLDSELKDKFGAFPEIEFSKHFVLVAKKSVSGKETWNWSTTGLRGGVYYRRADVDHKYIVYVY